ncbi:MAG TPA: right-handed parallel beta-helix repeat-containing protein [Nitrososphaeraceae archaeon]|nr:right-handed parallel beta-helix repeat-containing protein [Nitrososphaeraceae archaeon]
MHEEDNAGTKLFSCLTLCDIAILSVLLIFFSSLPSLIPSTMLYIPIYQEAIAQAPRTAGSSSCINYDQSARLITVTCTSASLTDVYNSLNDPNILGIERQRESSSSSGNLWLLNANLKISQGATFYINPTDTAWLKIISDGTAAYKVDVHGSLKVDSVKITSWDPETNYYAVTNGTRIPNGSGGYEVHVGASRPFIRIEKDATGTTDITNSEIAYLGYEGGVGVAVTGLYYLGGDGSVLRHNNLHDLYFGFYSRGVGGMIIENNHIYNNSRYGLDPHTGTHDMIIRSNVVNDNGWIGIICSLDCHNITIENNEVYNNKESGIMFSRNMYNSIARNNYVHNEGIAIFVSQSHNNEIYNNTVSDSSNAIYLNDSSSNNIIHHNTVINSPKGINAFGAGGGNTYYLNSVNGIVDSKAN